MTRLQRLEKALRDDLSAMAEDFDSIMTNVDHSDLAWALSQLGRYRVVMCANGPDDDYENWDNTNGEIE